MLREAVAGAKVQKSVDPHSFRHARATHLANDLTEAQMKEYFGWLHVSTMAAVYVHLSGRDIGNAILRVHGKPDLADEQEERTAPKACCQCSTQNPATNRFCSACGMTLDRDTADQMLKNDLAHQQADNLPDPLMGHEEFRGLFMQKIHDLAQQRPLLPVGP
jgi:hypothetical protein